MRNLTQNEKDLITLLSKNSRIPVDISDLYSAHAIPFNDGSMGSIKMTYGATINNQIEASSALFRDADGVDVSIALFVDPNGRPTELDIWKVDFTPILEYPSPRKISRFFNP